MHLLKIFEHGLGTGRAAALSALALLPGANIDRLIWDAAADAEPAVQIEALNLLNSRDIPGAAARIMQFVGSPYEEVRNTIHKIMPHFQFSRFMQSFDQLDNANRRQLFNVVRNLDKRTPDELTKMLHAEEPMLKAKALLCIDYCRDIVPLVEDALCDILMRNELSTLRSKAAEQLAAGRQDASRTALVQALHRDTSPEVRTAARKSLGERPTYWA
jgi:HEAT repeat protein